MTNPIGQLPHRPPFLFVSELVSAGEGRAETLWDLAGNEAFFGGHFPGDSLVPGVLLIEALAQTAGLSLVVSGLPSRHIGMLVHADVRFRSPVRPPARIAMTAVALGGLGQLHRFEVTARHDGRVVADGTLVLSIQLVEGTESQRGTSR